MELFKRQVDYLDNYSRRAYTACKHTKQNGKPRDIVARFRSYKEREMVYQDRRKHAITGTNVFINENHCNNTRQCGGAEGREPSFGTVRWR